MGDRAAAVWTPGYWGYNDGVYLWNAGYWASAVGFYGDIDYGYGYDGHGYAGGAWNGQTYRYNIAVTNVDRRFVHAVYVKASSVERRWNRVSYNGGRGGIAAIPTPTELAAEGLPHLDPTPVQEQHERNAAADRANFAAVNHGHPPSTIASSRG